MEIWPPAHFSPVHNHAGSHAIIRVLHGAIQVRLFPYLCSDLSGVPAFATTSFHKGEATWISPTLNQTHQLTNVGKSTCITIQCYMYDGKDRLHYDFFDYVDAAGIRKQYEPDLDMDFVAFKERMRAEWEGGEEGSLWVLRCVTDREAAGKLKSWSCVYYADWSHNCDHDRRDVFVCGKSRFGDQRQCHNSSKYGRYYR